MSNQDLELIFKEIEKEIKLIPSKGEPASYIPELANVNPAKFGISLITLDGKSFGFGHRNEKFSIQSIAKAFSLTLAYSIRGESLWNRLGVEPSGTPFNSLVQLEYEKGIPRNPFINAGAIVICDILSDILDDPKAEFLEFVRKIANNSSINYNIKVAESEKATGYRNTALINMMKSFNNINNDIEEILDFYYHMCSIDMTCNELAQSFLLYSNHGVLPHNREKIISTSKTKRINSIMQTCGFYDEAGEFTFKVGLPGKSGVGGGIAAIHPGKYAVAVWSPRLNAKGNSYLGMKALELLTTKIELSIF
jgi:glutaminase